MLRSRRILLTCCASALALGATPASATPPLPGERIFPNVSSAGVDLAGLTVDEAVQKLEGLRPRLEDGAVSVRAADIPFKLKTSQADVAFDALITAKRALYAGREAQGAPVQVPLEVTYSRRAVRAFADRVDRRLTVAPRDSRAVIRLSKIKITHSQRGRDIDGVALAKGIGARLVDPRIDRLLEPRLLRPRPKVTAAEARKQVRTVLTIDQSLFKLRLFKNLKIVRTYRVAVGQPAYPTPNGLFAIRNKAINPAWSVPNSPWAGELAGSTVAGGTAANPLKARWMGIVNGVGIHGTGQNYSIGTRASHGCIRMHVWDVKALYRRVPVGTPVLIAR